MASRGLPALLAFVAAVGAVALAGTLATLGAAATYAGLRGPAWAPPAWLFGPVWTVLYVLIAVSGWLAWRAGTRLPDGLAAYGAQLALNGFWSPLFFALGWRGAALGVIVLLGAAIAVTMLQFRRRSRAAALLLAPYLLWVLFATALNFAYWTLNR